MKAILHLGTEKTGSSSIQRFFHVNRDRLLEQGFYFMKETGLQNDRKLAVYSLLENEYDDFHAEHFINNKERKKAFEKKLEEDIKKELKSLPKNIHTVIFSSEHFHSRAKKPGNRLKIKSFLDEFFSSYQLISYIRPQIDVSISHYSTRLKTKSFCEIDEHLTGCNPSNKYYDYFSFLSGWSDAFPDEKFDVRIFNKAELYKGDVVADICHLIGISSDSLESVPQVNESVRPTGQEMLKIINKNMPSLIDGVGRNQERVLLVRIINRIFPGSGQKPDSDTARNIQSQFDEINRKVRDRWFPDRPTLFNIDFKKLDNQEPVDWPLVEFFESFLKEYLDFGKGQKAGVPPENINGLRDLAVSLESTDIGSSYLLMQTAALLRPEGKFIKSKLDSYRNRIR